MEKKQDPVLRIAMNYGAIGGIAISLIRFLTYLAHATFGGISLIRWLILIVLIILGTKILRDKFQDRQIKYSKALASGILISFFTGVIFGFYVYIEFSYIAPELMEEFLIIQEEGIMKIPFFDDYQIEEAINNMRESASPMKFGFSEIFSTTFWGFIFSLITSAFLKKDNPVDSQIIENTGQF